MHGDPAVWNHNPTGLVHPDCTTNPPENPAPEEDGPVNG
ncbi:hypothetical protein BDK92_7290 [Micromonospora pisi]|uniref:Uncharacterized protein n=1 Tax=Micromonospora pisi TaxID=589240 RepID=A0A495JW50_9ACTN|nr:hypothetical protein BDK92_7290 [Micromonospora pisi]